MMSSVLRPKKNVLITGASAGLGLEIAKLLSRHEEYFLILTARPNSMARFPGTSLWQNPNCRFLELDVTNENQRREVITSIYREFGGVDILINNAGVAYRSVVEHASEEERQTQMEINYRAPMELVKLVLPHMRESRQGQIINISSVGGMMAMPTMSIYSASKFALEGATESLYYEAKPWNVKVTLVEPGFIRSKSFKNTRLTESCKTALQDENNSYINHYENMGKFINFLMRHAISTSAQVAKKVELTIRDPYPPLRVAGTFDALIFSYLRRFLPRSVYHWLLYKCLPSVSTWGPEHSTKSSKLDSHAS